MNKNNLSDITLRFLKKQRTTWILLVGYIGAGREKLTAASTRIYFLVLFQFYCILGLQALLMLTENKNYYI